MPIWDFTHLSNKDISIIVLANAILEHYGLSMSKDALEDLAAENRKREDIAHANQIDVCQECGSNDVEMQVWQNLRTNKIDDSDSDHFYCNTCKEDTKIEPAFAIPDLGCFIRLCGDIEIKDGKRHSELETCAMLQDGSMSMGDKGPGWYNPDFYHNEGTEDFDRFIRTAQHCYPDVVFKRT